MNAMKKLLLTVVLGAAFGTCAAQAPSASDQSAAGGPAASAPIDDTTFAKKAAQDGLAEVQLGKIAQKRASDPAVKSYAEQLVASHSNANNKLLSIAKAEGIKLPNALSKEDQKLKTELNKLSGAQFDKRFMEAQIDHHQKAVDLFTQESASGKSPQLKQFATDTLPHLQSHLDQANKISADLSGGTGTPSGAPAQ